MTKKFLKSLLILTIFMVLNEAQANELIDTLKITDFEFKFWIGHQKNLKVNHSYCLLGVGFFRTPIAKNTDSLISTWIENHPDAIVIPVYTFGPTMNIDPNSKQTYCWVVDKSDTLNIHLVRQGAVPGGTMQRPRTSKEMSKKERKTYHDLPNEEVHVSDQAYLDFLEKIKIAEEYARKSKLGIYADKEIDTN
ncbi:hypothetical protein [Marinigracilibium pacificum]|uniref:TNase-like domain-containing protein n=1 Tax=Marinigracilibium pacificum TaxID=2729599 RepID=A0A848J501_9BACT|nr:hypothetical protein [Marinigracilibium pacificum]NMM50796.1 hypothetical protein [Marinigracilibium pacificum]